MSEPTTPSKGQTKRRGLALPPRGQALARLQDLEQENEHEQEQDPEQKNERGIAAPEATSTDQSFAEVSNSASDAVNTASSNAVNHQSSTPEVKEDAQRQDVSPPVSAAPAVFLQEVPPSLPAATAPGARLQTPARAVREPTTRITVDMPDSLHRKISLLSVEARRSIKDLVIEALMTTYFETDADKE